ncbi:Transient receptor putative cation channel sub V member 4 [Blyttiomyces sp. JEL0837]|nr:Transient receptor putative cation channel sub V member 4 [Blyttiomyces sp. JEL0837]
MTMTFLLVILFTIAASLQPSALPDRRTYAASNPRDVVRAFCELSTIIGTVIMIFFEFREVSLQGIAYFTSYGSEENVLQWLFSVLIWTVPILRYAAIGAEMEQEIHFRDAENVIIGFSAILGWVYLLYFAKGFHNLGPLVLILRRILFKDFFEWLVLYGAFTIGFSVAFYLQMNDVPKEVEEELAAAAEGHNSSELIIPVKDWDIYPGSTLWVIRFIFAQAIFDDFRRSKLPEFTEFLFILYGFIAIILLVNVLIAKLTETFKSIALDSQRQWKVQFATLVLGIDEHLSPKEKQNIIEHMGWTDDAEELARESTPAISTSNKFNLSRNTTTQSSITLTKEAPTRKTRYFIFVERKIAHPSHSGSGEGGEKKAAPQDKPLKMIVANDRENDTDIEIRTDVGHWDGWHADLFRSKDRRRLWAGHPHSIAPTVAPAASASQARVSNGGVVSVTAASDVVVSVGSA